ncbi:PASTA domain-containing protein [Micromonospora musae]|uniref:PASTA domain-containing protein n=1 Tax=Micromonospora musae TaxID=1894970 RepID=A0A3A9XWN1_9ACTN|nr:MULTISPECIES: PASTA domain-containing protein [Micromonospora]RKN13995.1 PASTA domain-containing protein [Micromonospora musae]RKN29489.1 PASTA domain-containing protein [Micromonospora musae]TYB99586.1 PASTA domain-containing protein [Micromonospora sp. WP24]
MTDGNTNGNLGERREGSPGRLTVVLGGGMVAVLLAAIGATGGWLLAGEGEQSPEKPVAAPSATGAASGRPSHRPEPTRTTPSAPRTSASTASGLTVPPVIGTDFLYARDELRDLRLGWRLVFGDGAGRSIERTDPEVGREVRRGTTVTLYVAGPPPESEVPDVVGDDCADAADELGESGFYPDYPNGKRGEVTRQEPSEGGSARWNDQVRIWCGAEKSNQPPFFPAP